MFNKNSFLVYNILLILFYLLLYEIFPKYKNIKIYKFNLNKKFFIKNYYLYLIFLFYSQSIYYFITKYSLFKNNINLSFNYDILSEIFLGIYLIILYIFYFSIEQSLNFEEGFDYKSLILNILFNEKGYIIKVILSNLVFYIVFFQFIIKFNSILYFISRILKLFKMNLYLNTIIILKILNTISNKLNFLGSISKCMDKKIYKI